MAPATVVQFDDEGSGYSVQVPLAWKAGTPYKFTLSPYSQDLTWWSMTISYGATAMNIGRIQIGDTSSLQLASANFTEYYSSLAGCANLSAVTASFAPPAFNGDVTLVATDSTPYGNCINNGLGSVLSNGTVLQSVLNDGTHIVTNAKSNLLWDDTGSSTVSGTSVDLYSATGNPNQNWLFTALGGGYFEIVNAYSGLSLNDPASSTTAGTLLIQYAYQGTDNEAWLLTPSSSGYVITGKASGLAVDPGANTSGADLQQELANGTPAQTWLVQ